MVWELEYDQKSYAIDQHYAQGIPLNRSMQDFVDQEPELELFEDLYLRAFWRLVTERRGGPVIPYSEIIKYAETLGLDSAMIETFVEIIWGLERAYAKWCKSQVPIANK